MPNLSTLPPEILLSIIPHIPFTPSNYTALQKAHPRLAAILSTHEPTLSLAIRKTQYPPTTLSLFPSLHANYPDLLTLHTRLQTLADLHETWMQVTNNGPDLGWLRTRYHSIHLTGTLLLHRLTDLPTPSSRHDLLHLLPARSLACLTFKLYSSIKILRIYGPAPLNAAFAKDDWETRSEVELAFEECLLVHGPELFGALLQVEDWGRREWAVAFVDPITFRPQQVFADFFARILNKELASMEARQYSPASEPTLVSTLRRSFAGKTHGEHVGKNAGAMWEVLSGTAFDCVGEVEMGRLVAGEEVEGGLRRMGF